MMSAASANSSDRVLSALVARGVRRRYGPATTLLREGDTASSVWVVQRGLVKMHRTAFDGRDVVVEFRGPGELLGEMSSIDGQVASLSMTAVSDVDAVVVPADAFRSLLPTDQALAAFVLVNVMTRLREAAARHVELVTEDALGRLAIRLVDLADRYGVKSSDGSVVIESPISQQELADWAGISRDAAVRSLGTLRRVGWVETGRRRFVIRSLERLRERADQAT